MPQVIVVTPRDPIFPETAFIILTATFHKLMHEDPSNYSMANIRLIIQSMERTLPFHEDHGMSLVCHQLITDIKNILNQNGY